MNGPMPQSRSVDRRPVRRHTRSAGPARLFGLEGKKGVVAAGAIPIVLGGDHSIAHPDVAAVADGKRPDRVGVIHFDAHADDADESELLGQHREDEVGMRLGQVEELLAAFHQAEAGQSAGADGDHGLDDVEAAALRVGVVGEAHERAEAVRGHIGRLLQRPDDGLRFLEHLTDAAEVREVHALRSTRQQPLDGGLQDLGLDAGGMPPEELAALIRADIPRLGKIEHDGISVEIRQALEPWLPRMRMAMESLEAARDVGLLAGTPVAYLLAQRRFRFLRLLDALMDLPTVLPPSVAGVALLMAFGRRGLFGPLLLEWGISLPFTTAAVVIAQTFIAAPFYVRAATIGFSAIDPELKQAASLDGASRWQQLRHITLLEPSGELGASPHPAPSGSVAWIRANSSSSALPSRMQEFTPMCPKWSAASGTSMPIISRIRPTYSAIAATPLSVSSMPVNMCWVLKKLRLLVPRGLVSMPFSSSTRSTNSRSTLSILVRTVSPFLM